MYQQNFKLAKQYYITNKIQVAYRQYLGFVCYKPQIKIICLQIYVL